MKARKNIFRDGVYERQDERQDKFMINVKMNSKMNVEMNVDVKMDPMTNPKAAFLARSLSPCKIRVRIMKLGLRLTSR